MRASCHRGCARLMEQDARVCSIINNAPDGSHPKGAAGGLRARAGSQGVQQQPQAASEPPAVLPRPLARPPLLLGRQAHEVGKEGSRVEHPCALLLQRAQKGANHWGICGIAGHRVQEGM